MFLLVRPLGIWDTSAVSLLLNHLVKMDMLFTNSSVTNVVIPIIHERVHVLLLQLERIPQHGIPTLPTRPIVCIMFPLRLNLGYSYYFALP